MVFAMKNQYEDDWEYLGLLPIPANPAVLAEQWKTEVLGSRDGEGKRFWIPALLLLANENQKALLYCSRYEKAQVDEVMDSAPEYLMCYLLAKIKDFDNTYFNSSAAFIMRRLYGSNPYILPLLLNQPPINKDYWHFRNTSTLEYAENLPYWLFELWLPEDTLKLKAAYESIEFASFMNTDDCLWKMASDLPVGQNISEALARHQSYRDVMFGVRANRKLNSGINKHL
jgi:hypothetical protein